MRTMYSYHGKGAVKDFTTTQVVIGPKESVKLDLNLTLDMAASRPDARVWVENGRYWIEDLNSRRGTRVSVETPTYQDAPFVQRTKSFTTHARIPVDR